ncbi:MAG: RimK/LysX family protein [Alphaproteobacteria bacterium]
MAKIAVKKPKITIGWEEWCSLPDLNLPAVKAKIDTGAKTSALHAYDIETYIRHNIPFVRFKIHPLQRDKKLYRVCEAPLVENRTITSSNGERELRPVILTALTFGSVSIDAELTLTSRHNMNFRMLLGREALRKARFVVDPARSFLLGKIKKPEKLF